MFLIHWFVEWSARTSPKSLHFPLFFEQLPKAVRRLCLGLVSDVKVAAGKINFLELFLQICGHTTIDLSILHEFVFSLCFWICFNYDYLLYQIFMYIALYFFNFTSVDNDLSLMDVHGTRYFGLIHVYFTTLLPALSWEFFEAEFRSSVYIWNHTSLYKHWELIGCPSYLLVIPDF